MNNKWIEGGLVLLLGLVLGLLIGPRSGGSGDLDDVLLHVPPGNKKAIR